MKYQKTSTKESENSYGEYRMDDKKPVLIKSRKSGKFGVGVFPCTRIIPNTTARIIITEEVIIKYGDRWDHQIICCPLTEIKDLEKAIDLVKNSLWNY